MDLALLILVAVTGASCCILLGLILFTLQDEIDQRRSPPPWDHGIVPPSTPDKAVNRIIVKRGPRKPKAPPAPEPEPATDKRQLPLSTGQGGPTHG